MNDLISRQAAIDAVMEFMPSLTTPDGCGQFDREIFEAQEMFVDIGQALNKLPSAPQWIPCSDRLPSEDGRYLISCWLMKDMPWISVMYYGKPTFPETDHPCFYVSDDEYGDVEYNDIVAWMPLPKPYEEREGE